VVRRDHMPNMLGQNTLVQNRFLESEIKGEVPSYN
jgi:hypothetical protein